MRILGKSNGKVALAPAFLEASKTFSMRMRVMKLRFILEKLNENCVLMPWMA
jgi:hypothetical protein